MSVLIPSPEEIAGIQGYDLFRLIFWVIAMYAVMIRILVDEHIVMKHKERLMKMEEVVHKIVRRQKEMDVWQQDLTDRTTQIDRLNDQYRKYLHREKERLRRP